MTKVGIPKEIKNNENRVGMTPSGVAELVRRGHQVFVQHTAGEGSGFADADYEAVGAKILPAIEDVYREADMIVKVKEPIAPEYRSDNPKGPCWYNQDPQYPTSLPHGSRVYRQSCGKTTRDALLQVPNQAMYDYRPHQ